LDVYEAVTSRRAVRGLTDREVPREVMERVLSAAARAPSGSNIQPRGDPWDEPEYEQYPPALKSRYRERRSAFGEQRYGALGIPREDVEARRLAASANRDCFGAPTALFCCVDRDPGPAQWSDTCMFLQTVMLLLRDEGLHSYPQMAWAKFRRSVAEILSPPDELTLFCGMSIGYEDVSIDHARTGRAPLDETVTFVEH
jgi:nitroreductase